MNAYLKVAQRKIYEYVKCRDCLEDAEIEDDDVLQRAIHTFTSVM
jgi:hypothetical protein